MKNKTAGSLFVVGAVLVSTIGLSGCAHFVMRGSVAQVESDNEAQVCLGNHEAKVGDRVSVFKITCSGGSSGKTGTVACGKTRVGGGTVTQLLNEHMSIIKVDAGVPFKEGTVVEKE